MSKLGIGGAAAIAVLLLAGCATQDDDVNRRLDSIQAEVDGLKAQVGEHETRITALEQNSQAALDRAKAAGKLRRGAFDYSLVLSDADTRFPTDGWALSDQAKARLAEFAGHLKADNRNVYLEIQGFTDKAGTPEFNYALGWRRAEAVRLFLNEQGVPLNRMSSISFGQTHPLAANDTPAGRAQNRRVVLVVLE